MNIAEYIKHKFIYFGKAVSFVYEKNRNFYKLLEIAVCPHIEMLRLAILHSDMNVL